MPCVPLANINLKDTMARFLQTRNPSHTNRDKHKQFCSFAPPDTSRRENDVDYPFARHLSHPHGTCHRRTDPKARRHHPPYEKRRAD